jgi:hypothetical protein
MVEGSTQKRNTVGNSPYVISVYTTAVLRYALKWVMNYCCPFCLFSLLGCVWGTFSVLRKGRITFFMSVRPSAWNSSALTGQMSVKFDIWGIFEILLRNFKFHYNRIRITGTFNVDQYKFSIISRSFLLRMKNVSYKHCRDIKNTHFMFNRFSSKIVPFMG